jgi:hypothetical protein
MGALSFNKVPDCSKALISNILHAKKGGGGVLISKCDQSFTLTECNLRFLPMPCTSYTENLSQLCMVEMSSRYVTSN